MEQAKTLLSTTAFPIGKISNMLGSPESLSGSPTFDQLEQMAHKLEASGRYRILRRIEPETRRFPLFGCKTRRAVFVDVETMGVDVAQRRIIPLRASSLSSM